MVIITIIFIDFNKPSNIFLFLLILPLLFTRRLSKDLTSAVFDIPEEHLEVFQKTIDETVGFKWLSICDELPPLKMLEEKGFDRSPGGRGGSRGININYLTTDNIYSTNIKLIQFRWKGRL